MAHYALLDSNNIVVKVITGVDENITQTDLDGKEVGGSSEAWEQFYASQHEGLTCKRTSYNNNIRAHFAGIGMKYDEQLNVFIPKQPYPSWKLNYTNYQWVPPIDKPDTNDGYRWIWSEYNNEWVSLPLAE
jgi:hypothetical protein